ncbi:Hsp33 family molecular chaperone HslO [Salipaludibacillus sp. LMS25]|jgi:molecular chaperone Hsp33|uniref:Hsp33 family molecular chaperone HslO n=1 Tax=Salipaludibacillus sp. LMS25 TaxID=2924031 RepID=UPI0020D12DC1|nr:Hsp33 family molecular chaperone HslO [Salipaludibacillus sp. LMS25]UTR16673.1 Hsp33 family molecular chaperone HslO [Salipaludibacillus sp. LMS25]
MKDYLVKALAFEDTVRIYAIQSTEMVKEAAKRQKTWRTVTAALGRALTAGTMMGAMLKGDEKLTIKIEGNGPASPIIVDAKADGTARGYVTHPHLDPVRKPNGKLDVSAVVGTEGSLSVVKDLGMKEHFTGSVPLVSGELGEDFTYYFASSEQTPSSVALGVIIGQGEDVDSAGGFIIQMMPGVKNETVELLEQTLSNIPPISSLIQQGKTPEQIIALLAGENNYRIMDKMSTLFQCQCSKERIANAIIGLGEKEIIDMIEEDGSAETTCHFCNEIYTFSREELQTLLEEKRSEDS